MVCIFFGLNRVFPEQVPVGLPVILGAAGGCAVAVGNFFLMALTVQKVAGIENYDQGREFLPDGADCAESSRN